MTTATVITHRITPIQIINVDEPNQILTVKVWVGLRWVDECLRWNASHYGGLNSISIPSIDIWQPDITLFGSIDKEFDRRLYTDVQVSSDGSVYAPQPMVYKASCPIDATYFPFDQQECVLEFGSWSYDGSVIDLEINPASGSLSNYIPNGEWNLMGVSVIKHAVYYTCCPQPYPHITYTFVMQRRPLFYIFTILMPVTLMFFFILVGFYLPTQCRERMTIFVTGMLAAIMFLSLATKYLPSTSDSMSYMQKYMLTTIGLSALSSVLTGFSVNLHYQTCDAAPVPGWLRTFVFKYLAVIVLMPGTANKYLNVTDYSKHVEVSFTLCCIDRAIIIPPIPPNRSTKNDHT
ncbi:neuronal acetylcholine receptor subunit alpha-10-like [Saccoglossus kowalevskii]